MWLSFIRCASLFFLCIVQKAWREASPPFESGWPQSKGGFSDFRCVRVGEERWVLLGWSLSVVSSHRQPGTGSVVVSATCATMPLSPSLKKTRSKSQSTAREDPFHTEHSTVEKKLFLQFSSLFMDADRTSPTSTRTSTGTVPPRFS